MAGPPNNIPLRAKGYLESGIGLITSLTLTRILILTHTLNRALTLTLVLTLTLTHTLHPTRTPPRTRPLHPGYAHPGCWGATKIAINTYSLWAGSRPNSWCFTECLLG